MIFSSFVKCLTEIFIPVFYLNFKKCERIYIIQKMSIKSQPQTLFLFWKINQNSHCMQEILVKIRYFERGLSKILRKLTLFFLSKPVSSNGQSYQKQNQPGTSEQLSSGYKLSSETFLYQLCIIQPNLMMQHKPVFELLQESYLQIYVSQFMTS